MKYEIISRDDQAKLAEAVNEYLAAGWELQGGVSVASHFASWENSRKGYTESEHFYIFAQALVKRS